MKYKIKEHILVLALVYLGFFIDSINAVLIKVLGENNSLSLVNRILTEAVFVTLLLKNRIYRPIKYLIFFFSIAIIGMLFTVVLQITNIPELLQNIVIVNKVLYFFIVVSIIYYYFDNQREILFKFFEIVYFIFIISILFGFIFQIPFLESYPQEKRFGYKGLIVTQNEAVGIFLIGLFYFSAKYEQLRNNMSIVYIIFILIGGLLTGSKANMFFLTLSTVLIYIYYVFKSKKMAKTVILFIPILFMIDWNRIFDIFSTTINYITSFYNKGMDIWSILLSGRNWRVQDMMQEIANEPYFWYNYLFGGFNFSRMGTEMDMFDIWQLFGFIGTSAFYIIYISTIINYSKKSILVYLFLIVWLIASSLGGHLIYNAVIPIYLSIMLLRFTQVHESKICLQEK